MGAQLSKYRTVSSELKQLTDLLKAEGEEFPGCDYETTEHKQWMSLLDMEKAQVKEIVWPGSHDSATNRIGIPLMSRPFAQCQHQSMYRQLVQGVRAFDIRVDERGRVCHGILRSYPVQTVFHDLKKFLTETKTEFLIVEFRTEYAHDDPPDFDKLLISELGEHLIPQDPAIFDRSLQKLLPHRVICIWKPQKLPAPSPGSLLWSSAYLKDNWTDTDLPYTKFRNNLSHLQAHAAVHCRPYFYRVENTCTPQADNLVVCVKPVTRRIMPYARLFISQAHKTGIGDHIQIFSSDFVDADFVNACIGATMSRVVQGGA